jgi:hypothetical protein
MVAIKFIEDYRGYLTGEKYFPAGTVAELDEANANVLVARGYAVIIEEEKPAPKAKVRK